MMNDSALNNHVHKHYGMVMSCYHDGYTTGSVLAMGAYTSCITEQFTYFNKRIYTLYIVVLVVYSLIW